MFVKLDALFAGMRDRLRATARDDAGATLVAVLGIMAVGFIVAAIIAAACMFTITQTAQGRTDAKSFAAAEAGRDAVVSVLSQTNATDLCTNSTLGIGHFKSAAGQTPAYESWVQSIDSGTPPTSWQGAVGSGDVPAVPSCPTDDTKYIVVRSIGTSANGGREVIDAVYKWQLGKEVVAGGGLGYQGVSYSASASTIKGDMIVKNGNLECNYGTVFDGSVYVLNGNVNVGADAFLGWGGDACTINGELVVAGTVNFKETCTLWIFVCLASAYGTINVGGPAHVQGNLDLADGGALKVGTDPVADNPSINDVEDTYTTRDLTVSGHINDTATPITTSNGGSIKAVDYISTTKALTAAGGIATGGDLTAKADVLANGGDIAVAGRITGTATVKASASMSAGAGGIDGTGARTATGGSLTTTGAIGGGVVVTAGGSVKALGNISTSGTVTAGGDIQTSGTLNGGARTASGSITTTQAINTAGNLNAGANLVTNGNLAGDGTRTAGGTISVKGDLSGSGATKATGNLTVKGTISGNGSREATNGALWGDNSGNFSGSGAKTAKYVYAASGISGTGSVTASQNLIVVGNVSNNNALTAAGGTLSIKGTPGTGAKSGGTVLIQGAVSGGAVTATNDLEITGDVTGSGALTSTNGRIAVSGSIGTSGTATTGALSAKTSILVGGLLNLSGASVTTTGSPGTVSAVNDLKMTTGTACDISGDLRAGGILYLPQSGGSSANTSTSTNPYCTIAGKVQSASSTAKSSLAGRYWRVRVGANTGSSTTMESANGWQIAGSGSTARYLKGATTTNPSGSSTTNTTTPTLNTNTTTNPKPGTVTPDGALTAPVNGTMAASSSGEAALTANPPTGVTAPSAPVFVLNERTVKTWSDIADLQLRTTWLDLGTYTDWGPDYYPVTLSGSTCTSWLGLGGQLTKILNTAGEVRNTATGQVLVPATATNVVIDATACTNTITMTWAATNLKRDAVILVNNVSFDLASMGSQSAVHQLFVVQVDKNPAPQLSPRGVVEPVPNCSTGQNKISINGDGIFGTGTYKARVLLYTPCGVSGGWVNNWAGHIYASGSDSVDTNVLSTYTCVDMSIPSVISLPCDIDTIVDTGHMNIAAYAIGDRLTQTEP